jgi:hypothetical protein
MANLALAVLASYAVYGLIKNKFSSFKQQLVLTAVIGFVILFEFSMIPYPSYSESLPDIYEEIKNDESKFAVLPVPTGGIGDYGLMSNPLILYHQLHHEKPIYGGHESRVSHETLSNTETYFLNMFHIHGSKDDVIKQDLATHGLSLFDHFDIKYVTLHKDYAFVSNIAYHNFAKAEKIHDDSHSSWQDCSMYPQCLPAVKQIMSEILSGNDPVYEDDRIAVYKIPKPNSSEPFLLLGSGWHVFDPEYDIRTTMKNSEILIVNPTNSEIYVTLNLVLSSLEKEKVITISVNNIESSRVNIHPTFQNIQLENLMLKSGVNVVTFDADEFLSVEYGLEGSKTGKWQETTANFQVKSISIQP